MSKFKLNKNYKPKNFLDLYVPEEVTFENSEVVVLPYGYEGTVTFGDGTKKGPKKLIEASWQVELFDTEILDDIQNKIKIWTAKQPKIPKNINSMVKNLKEIILEIFENKKLPVVIGGEHSISYGFAQAINEKYKDVSVLVFDSHMDLKDRYSGKDFSHASWLKYSLDLPNIKTATLIGIRNCNLDEYNYSQENKSKINIFWAKDRKNWDIKQIVDSLNENVYLSFDIDALDSSIMPSTGTPEPSGIFFDETLEIIKEVAKNKNIIGIDLVELAPIKKLHAPDFLAAKLLMKMILYKFKAKNTN
ncbi:MAG: agmatinase [Patescibacteria group bacterium]